MTPPSPATARIVTSPRRPVPAPERPRHLEVVRGRPVPGRRPPRPFVVLLVVATGASLLALVIANVLLGQVGIRAGSLTSEVSKKRTAVELLELDVARLAAPEQIANRAWKIGLVPATDVTVLYPGAPGSSLARAARARPQPAPSPSTTVKTAVSTPARGPSPKSGRP